MERPEGESKAGEHHVWCGRKPLFAIEQSQFGLGAGGDAYHEGECQERRAAHHAAHGFTKPPLVVLKKDKGRERDASDCGVHLVHGEAGERGALVDVCQVSSGI